MVVTHLMQILAFLAMEPPTELAPLSITEEKNKVFRSIRPIDPANVVRGRYEGYLSEPGVAPDSDTETMIALRCEIDNWRWSGVPFYLRTGKRMAEGARIISIAFREPPQSMFPAHSGVGEYGPDHLTFDLNDNARLSLSFYGKLPGPTMKLEKTSMQFSRQDSDSKADGLEAYERLFRDAMAGDHTLFTTAEGIERLWEISAPLLESPPPIEIYPVGSWGPPSVHNLIEPERLAPAVRPPLARLDNCATRSPPGCSTARRPLTRRFLDGLFDRLRCGGDGVDSGVSASTCSFGSRRSSHPGSHQARLPISSMIAGTRMLRITNASMNDGRCQGDAEQLDRQVPAERERGEDADHDRGGRRDHPAGRGEAVDDRLGGVLALLPLLVDARHQEDLVVHREAEDDREDHHRQERLDRRRGVEPDQAPEPTPLEDRDDDAERGADA